MYYIYTYMSIIYIYLNDVLRQDLCKCNYFDKMFFWFIFLSSFYTTVEALKNSFTMYTTHRDIG